MPPAWAVRFRAWYERNSIPMAMLVLLSNTLPILCRRRALPSSMVTTSLSLLKHTTDSSQDMEQHKGGCP